MRDGYFARMGSKRESVICMLREMPKLAKYFWKSPNRKKWIHILDGILNKTYVFEVSWTIKRGQMMPTESWGPFLNDLKMLKWFDMFDFVEFFNERLNVLKCTSDFLKSTNYFRKCQKFYYAVPKQYINITALFPPIWHHSVPA